MHYMNALCYIVYLCKLLLLKSIVCYVLIKSNGTE